MTYKTKRRLRRELHAAHVKNAQLAAKHESVHDVLIDHANEQIAELTAENSRLMTLVDDLTGALQTAETHTANLRKQLDDAVPFLDTPRRIVTGFDPYAAENGRLRDENKKLHQLVAELTTANHAQDVRVGSVDIFQADGAA